MCNGKKEFKIKRGQIQKTYDDEDGGDESYHSGDDNGVGGGDDNGDGGGGVSHEDGGGNFGGDDEDALKKDANVGPATVE